MMKPIPLIKKGDAINIILKNTNLEVKLKGKALSDGKKNDIIRIKSSDYKKILKGEVIDSKNVQINII